MKNTAKIFLIYSLTFIFSTNLTAQTTKIFLLKEELKIEKKEKKPVSLLIQIAELFLTESPDSTLKYSSEALSISNNLNLFESNAKSYLLLGKAYNEKNQHQDALNKIQLSENIYRTLKNNTGLGHCYFQKSYAFTKIGKSDSCAIYLDKSIEIFKAANNKLQLATIDRIRGLNFWSMGEYREGVFFTNKAIETYRQLKDSINLAKGLNTRGAILWGLASYEMALKDFFESLYLKEELGDRDGQIIIAYNNIGFVYQDWSLPEEALVYFKKAEKMIPISKNKLGIAYTYLNLGTYFLNQNKSSKALELLEKAKNGYAAMDDINGVSLVKIRIAQCYSIDGNLELAKTAFFDAIKDAEESKNNHRIALAYYQLSKNEFAQNQMQQSISYSLKSLELADAGNYKDLQYLIYKHLSLVYEELDQANLSLKMLQKVLVLKDEIYHERIAGQSQIMELTRENEKNEFENELLKTQNISKEKTIRNQAVAVIIVVFLLAVISIYNYSLNKKKKDLQVANQAKDKIFSIVSHDLRGPVGNLNSMVELMVTQDVKDYRRLLNMFKPVITNTYNMLENLLVWAKSNLGKLEIRGAKISLNSTIKETIQPFLIVADKKSISIEFKPKNDTSVFADVVLFQSIIRNLLNNAIKFTNEHGAIKILVEESKKQVKISIQDNGVGISGKEQETMFNGSHHTLGTNKEKGSGLGLLLCKELAEKNGGNLWVKSIEGKGSTFSFSVPLANSSQTENN